MYIHVLLRYYRAARRRDRRKEKWQFAPRGGSPSHHISWEVTSPHLGCAWCCWEALTPHPGVDPPGVAIIRSKRGLLMGGLRHPPRSSAQLLGSLASPPSNPNVMRWWSPPGSGLSLLQVPASMTKLSRSPLITICGENRRAAQYVAI